MAESELEQPDQYGYTGIWSRPGRWARQRAYIFLGINIVVFTALNMFSYWLHNAKYVDFTWESYAQTYHETLLDFLIFPISVYEVPVMIVVLGMLVAVIVMVPILVSQLYGFRFSLVFAAIVAVFGHMPVLSLFLVASVFIAAAPVARLPFRFGWALLALSPIIVYFYVATRGGSAWQERLVDPMALYAPWVLALLGCGLIAAIVLGFARLVHYRPGGVLCSMIPFFVIPGLLFDKYVGSDELEFRLLEHQYGPDSNEMFVPTDISSRVFQRTVHAWQYQQTRNLDDVRHMVGREIFYVAYQQLAENRNRVIQACQRFERRFDKSVYLPNVLYIKGLALDTHFNHNTLWVQWRVEYYNTFVSPQSRALWQEILDIEPTHPYAAQARYRLALIAARRGQMDLAVTLLTQLVQRWGNAAAATRPAPAPVSIWQFFTRPAYVLRPQIDTDAIARDGKELLELVENNRDDLQYGNLPLQKLMRLDRRHQSYSRNLLDIAGKCPNGKLEDNLLVLHALSKQQIDEQIELLEDYVQEFSGRDAGALACFELAKLYQALGLANMEPKFTDRAVQLYGQLVEDYAPSLLASQAQQSLKTIKPGR